jgi:hypothetical protein
LARTVGPAQMLAKLLLTEIPQECNFPVRMSPRHIRELIECKAEDTKARPAPPGAVQNPVLSIFRVSPNERYTLATDAGPQREIFDCHKTWWLNVAATGKRHARSKISRACNGRGNRLGRYFGMTDDPDHNSE